MEVGKYGGKTGSVLQFAGERVLGGGIQLGISVTERAGECEQKSCLIGKSARLAGLSPNFARLPPQSEATGRLS